MFQSKGTITPTVWKDNKDIHLISNAFPVSGEVTVPRKRKADGVVERVPCPPVLPGYNMFMGGVDLNDQKKSYYSVNRRSRRWWLLLALFRCGHCERSLPVHGDQTACVPSSIPTTASNGRAGFPGLLDPCLL